MNEYSPIVKAVRDGYPYTFEMDGRRSVLYGIQPLEDGGYTAVYHDGTGETPYLLDTLRDAETSGKIKVLAKHPTRPCVRARYDQEHGEWLLEVNHPTCMPVGWQEEQRFFCVNRQGESEDRRPSFISGHILECLADYVRRGFLFVDM